MIRIATGILIFGLSVTAYAQSAIEEEVKALVKKAVAEVRSKGTDTACKEFANPNGGYIKGELFVYVQDMRAKMICHATNPKLNGKDLIELKDPDGKYFNKEMVQIASTKGSGWVSYRFVNPVSKNVEPKTTYIEREGDLMVGAGYFKK